MINNLSEPVSQFLETVSDAAWKLQGSSMSKQDRDAILDLFEDIMDNVVLPATYRAEKKEDT